MLSMKMVEIKSIIKLAEDEPNLNEKSMRKIIGCSKNDGGNLNITKKGKIIFTNLGNIL